MRQVTKNVNYLETSTWIENYIRKPRVLNYTWISGNNENRKFCFQYFFEVYLDGKRIVFWKNTMYIMKEQKSKRIVC